MNNITLQDMPNDVLEMIYSYIKIESISFKYNIQYGR
jgi:hypothetical protein